MTARDPEQHILDCWQRNASPWVTAIRNGEVASRVLVTDRAILDALLALQPTSALDIGCGEGWLTEALQQHGIRTLGVDAIPALVAQAQQSRQGRFRQLAYHELSPATLGETFDLAVCNFSLLGETSTEQVFRHVGALLQPRGHFVVQTLHPRSANGDAPYEDGWRDGSWQGFSEHFADPAPWYFRTLESWLALFRQNGLQVTGMLEPVHPQTGQPASVIFIASITRTA